MFKQGEGNRLDRVQSSEFLAFGRWKRLDGEEGNVKNVRRAKYGINFKKGDEEKSMRSNFHLALFASPSGY